jgi:hypothetical protein
VIFKRLSANDNFNDDFGAFVLLAVFKTFTKKFKNLKVAKISGFAVHYL